MKKIIAISHTFNDTKYFVTECHKREDDQFIITGTSTDPNEAKDFGTPTAAKAVMIRINNPYNREYKYESIKVDPAKKPIDNLERIS